MNQQTVFLLISVTILLSFLLSAYLIYCIIFRYVHSHCFMFSHLNLILTNLWNVGQRGHGYLTRVDMNNFDISGIRYLDLTVTPRNQIPTMPEIDFRGFASVTASGQYAIFVPFFSGFFSGK